MPTRHIIACTDQVRFRYCIFKKSVIFAVTIAGIAQLVEHDLAKVGAASSSLVSRSKVRWRLRYGTPSVIIRGAFNRDLS